MTVERNALESFLVSEQATMREVVRALDRNGHGIVFLIDAQRRLKGVATDGDVRRGILRGLALEARAAEFMTAQPVKSRQGEPLEVLFGRMSDQVRHIPIVDQDDRVVDYATLSQVVRVPVASPSLGGNELRYVTECIVTNWISSQGTFVKEFERRVAEFCRTPHAVAVSNGTVALHLALVLEGLGPGDEVIVPALSFVATANAVRYTGATPVFVDVDPATWTINPEQVAARLSPRTKAIIPVHLYGHPADMDPLLALADAHGLAVIEDAAEAHGAEYRGRRVGSLGRLGCFSFFGNKIVTTGEGGMLTMSDARLAEQARLLRDHGMSQERKYHHEVIGFNYRLTNLQAAIGVAQMERVETMLARRQWLRERYEALLREEPRVQLLTQAPWARAVTWLFTVLLEDGVDRDEVMRRLAQHGIDSRPVFSALHQLPPYQTGDALPVAESIARRGLTLPTAVELEEADVVRVVKALRTCLPAGHRRAAAALS